MKKGILGLLLLVLLGLGAVYLFIPRQLNVSSVAGYRVNGQAASRLFSDEKNWKKWWQTDSLQQADGISLNLAKKYFNVYEVTVLKDRDTFKTFFEIIPAGYDSCFLKWNLQIDAGKSPLSRYAQYRKAVRMKKILTALIDKTGRFLEDPVNVYSMNIKAVKVTDSVLISTTREFTRTPDEKEINVMIQQLRGYIKSQAATEKNFPMLNIQELAKDKFEAMVAIPVDKQLPVTSQFAYKLVLKGGNLLEAEVKGGPARVTEGLRQIELYKSDYGRVSPAIPYQLLVTDRVLKPDTSGWITRLCYPVF